MCAGHCEGLAPAAEQEQEKALADYAGFCDPGMLPVVDIGGSGGEGCWSSPLSADSTCHKDESLQSLVMVQSLVMEGSDSGTPKLLDIVASAVDESLFAPDESVERCTGQMCTGPMLLQAPGMRFSSLRMVGEGGRTTAAELAPGLVLVLSLGLALVRRLVLVLLLTWGSVAVLVPMPVLVLGLVVVLALVPVLGPGLVLELVLVLGAVLALASVLVLLSTWGSAMVLVPATVPVLCLVLVLARVLGPGPLSGRTRGRAREERGGSYQNHLPNSPFLLIAINCLRLTASMTCLTSVTSLVRGGSSCRPQG